MWVMIWNVQIKLDLPEDSKFMSEVSAQDLAKSMDAELELFEQWFEEQGNNPLVGVERAILKTYLAWKLRYEDGFVDSKD
jgi:hypothetical protein